MKLPILTSPPLRKATGYAARAAGFTLIELLVVISIIALLIGILLPALAASRKTAKTSACISQLKQMGVATYGYANDYDNILPPSMNTTTFQQNFSMLLANYMGVSGTTSSSQFSGNTSSVRQIFECPEAKENSNPSPQNESFLTYSAHPRLFLRTPLRGYPPLPLRVRVEDMLRASELVMIFDGVQIEHNRNGVAQGAEAYNMDAGALGNSSLLLRSTAVGSDDTHAIDTGTNTDLVGSGVTDPAGNIRGRHHDNTIGAFLFGDGHAASIAYSADGTDLEQKNICVDK